MNGRTILKIATRKEYLGYLLGYVDTIAVVLFPSNNYIVLAVVVSVFAGLYLIHKYGN